MNEQDMLNAAQTAARLHYKNGGDIGIISEYSFDRAADLAFMPEDQCIEGIQVLCGVKIWYTKREEKDIFTRDMHKVRLLTILGTSSDIQLSHWLYTTAADTIETSFATFANTLIYKRNPTPIDAKHSFETGLAARINTGLKALALDYGAFLDIKAEKLQEALMARNYTFNPVAPNNKGTDTLPLAKRPRVRLNG
jgi:hypothetical protein